MVGPVRFRRGTARSQCVCNRGAVGPVARRPPRRPSTGGCSSSEGERCGGFVVVVVVVYDEKDKKIRRRQEKQAEEKEEGLCGRTLPNRNDVEWAKGCDVYITETQASLMSISSGVAGVPPIVGRFTIDAHHTPAYAAGYMATLIEPRLLMTTHMDFDPYQNDETVVEIREHWKGPFHLAAPDGIVVNPHPRVADDQDVRPEVELPPAAREHAFRPRRD